MHVQVTDSVIHLSVVVPMYKSAPYLPELLASFDHQAEGPYIVEFVFVDDGSPDESATLATQWLAASGRHGRVMRRAHGGVSSARNAGLEVATGDWIGFPDGDDIVEDHYFAALASALLRHQDDDAVLAAANVKRYMEAVDRVTSNHPLRSKFARGTRVVDLNDDPLYIQSQAASAFFRRDLLMSSGVRFLENLTIAEDAVFVGNYLLSAPAAKVLFVEEAEYLYRKRAAGDSSVDTVHTNRDFYFHRFERGYLPLFQRAAQLGEVPAWLDMLFIYDVKWFLPREANINSKATWMTPDERQRVLDALAAVLCYVADDSILSYNATALGFDHRCLLLALKGSALPTIGTAKVVHSQRRGVEVRYLYVGDLPTERFRRGDIELTPLAAKTRRLDVFHQELLWERIVWLPPGSRVTLELNGDPVPLEKGMYHAYELRPFPKPIAVRPNRFTRMRRRIANRLCAEVVALVPGAHSSHPEIRMRGRELRQRRLIGARLSVGGRRQFSDAWVLLDKVRAAGDSAEYLYRHLRSTEPDLNTWFVIDRRSPDWTRLKKDGFRLVAYGSPSHFALLCEAKVVISTHLDVEMTNPMPRELYPGRRRPWKYVYLQHGVLQHDLSIWFNHKPITLLMTASGDEYQSIVEDRSSYTLTSMQVRLTGFPRHDEVSRLAAAADPTRRNIILFAPTWRHHLLEEKTGPGALRRLKEPFELTEFGRHWLSLVNDPKLREIARTTNSRVVFLPHPNLRTQIDPALMAPGVELMTSVEDVHELLTRCRTVVTDYSSIFFEASLAGADVAYFQFDREEFLHGGHTYVPGYWSYEDHGFGPIGMTVGETVTIVRRQLEDPTYESERSFYRDRVQRTLPCVDGQSCARITAEVKALLA